jgi:hypothetical protein
MNIRAYIQEKKNRFQQQREEKLRGAAQDAEVRRYKAEIEMTQQEEIKNARIAEQKAKDMRRENSFVGQFMKSVKKKNERNLGKPSLSKGMNKQNKRMNKQKSMSSMNLNSNFDPFSGYNTAWRPEGTPEKKRKK